jgi:hypothetical protein
VKEVTWAGHGGLGSTPGWDASTGELQKNQSRGVTMPTCHFVKAKGNRYRVKNSWGWRIGSLLSDAWRNSF